MYPSTLAHAAGANDSLLNGDDLAGHFSRHLLACVGAMHLMEAAVLFASTQMSQHVRSTAHLCCLSGNVLHGASCPPNIQMAMARLRTVRILADISNTELHACVAVAVCACFLHKPWPGMKPTPVCSAFSAAFTALIARIRCGWTCAELSRHFVRCRQRSRFPCC